jgi:hypothetical protein
VPFVVSLNVQLTHPRLVVNPTTGVRDAIMGYWKMVVVDAPDADRARDLACGTVNDGMVVESKHSECDFGGLKPAIRAR